MNINYIKNKILSLIDTRHNFLYKGNRNQIEEFFGVIEKCYSRIFIIKMNDGKVKSFSYNDVIIGNLIINE